MKFLFPLLLVLLSFGASSQTKWTNDGTGYYTKDESGISVYTLSSKSKTVLANSTELTPKGTTKTLEVKDFFFSDNGKKLLIYTNSKKVWRLETRGDYYVLDLITKQLEKLGDKLPASSLMFAKFSPDGDKVAFVSKHNLYVQDLATRIIKQLTKDGSDRIINGTFDWVYEEEFGLRDGFRWSPDSRSIAYWQVDARKIRNFYLVNNTDSIYSTVIPVEYPKVGEDPSAVRIGVVNIASAVTKWMNIHGDPAQHYLVEMEWESNNNLVVQQLNRKQNQSKLMYVNTTSGQARTFYSETSNSWIDTRRRSGTLPGWPWINGGKDFLWVSEKDGWRHIYRVSRDGKNEQLLTKGNYDIIQFKAIDETNGFVYFLASPQNATQSYLYRTRLDGTGTLELVTPASQKGTHDYGISPNAAVAEHTFSSAAIPPVKELVALPGHKIIENSPPSNLPVKKNVEFFQLTTGNGVTMDGWMIKPDNFDSAKKYPVVFFLYAEPARQTVLDKYEYHKERFRYFTGDLAKEGYIYISIDNRGTPAPKGAAWRKSIYGQIGIINVEDQANAARKLLQWPFVDTSRIAVWGHSGGGSTTLSLMFRYPDIYKTGITLSPVVWRLSYDNIYEERYMGLPQENSQAYVDASALTHVKGLKGNLLVIHGTGDDNVHYQNTELLVNELVKQGKQFSMMAYPNRTHSLQEGEGTAQHLSTLLLNYLKQHCPPGGR